MSHAGWGELYHRALELYAAEPIELRLAIGLGLLLALVMMLEGLRTMLRPQDKPSPKQAMIASPAIAPIAPVIPVPPPARPAPQYQSTSPKLMATTRLKVVQAKAVKVRAKPFRSYRPRIRTAATGMPKLMVTDESAPFSSLPPHDA